MAKPERLFVAIIPFIGLIELILRTIPPSIILKFPILVLKDGDTFYLSDLLTSENMISPVTTISFFIDKIQEVFYSIFPAVTLLNFITLPLQILFVIGLFKKSIYSWYVLVLAVAITVIKDGYMHELPSLIGILIYTAIGLFILFKFKKHYH